MEHFKCKKRDLHITETDTLHTFHSHAVLSIKYKGLESEAELSDLMNEVASKVSAKWKQISIQLGLTPNDEECFNAPTPNDPIQCITSVFKKRATKLHTWSTVIEAFISKITEPR